jgi:hypothetical protein
MLTLTARVQRCYVINSAPILENIHNWVECGAHNKAAKPPKTKLIGSWHGWDKKTSGSTHPISEPTDETARKVRVSGLRKHQKTLRKHCVLARKHCFLHAFWCFLVCLFAPENTRKHSENIVF